MVLKTFNVDKEVYEKFSESCKSSGISMSKLINQFMISQVTNEPKVRESYIKRIEKLRQGRKIRVGSVENLKEQLGIK